VKISPEFERGLAIAAYVLVCCGFGAVTGGGMPLLGRAFAVTVPEMVTVGFYLLAAGFLLMSFCGRK
jgi:hypothetical protein